MRSTAVCVLLTVLAAFSLARPSFGQSYDGYGNNETGRSGRVDPFTDADEPFSRYDRNVKRESAGNLKSEYKFPSATTSLRKANLMPPKPQLVAPEVPEVKARLDGMESRRREVLKQIDTARAARDFPRVANLVVQLDELKQERLTYLRTVGQRVTPEPATKSVPDPTGVSPAASQPVVRPLLPIPTLGPRTEK